MDYRAPWVAADSLINCRYIQRFDERVLQEPLIMRGIKKNVPVNGKDMKKSPDKGSAILFSFKFFDADDDEICPLVFKQEYTRALMSRLKILCAWTAEKFQGKMENNIRNHLIDWKDTSRGEGFIRIPREHRDAPAYQFAVEEYNHGRVHGFFVGPIFHIVWLDCDHALYPQPKPDDPTLS